MVKPEEMCIRDSRVEGGGAFFVCQTHQQFLPLDARSAVIVADEFGEVEGVVDVYKRQTVPLCATFSAKLIPASPEPITRKSNFLTIGFVY